MVLLTTNFIEKNCTRIQSKKSLTKSIGKNFLIKMTHLYMDNKYIDAIGNISMCKNIRVMYLQNNNIAKLENFDFATNLSHLYLQHNNIGKLENLFKLNGLTHLFLGYNTINIVEGLENLKNLQLLHIEYQCLPVGESLNFDPRTLHVLSNQLKILNVAGNNLTSLEPLHCLCALEYLDARCNMIDDMLSLSVSINTLRSLRELLLHANPVTNQYRYWENLISNSNCNLVNLDGKTINETTRCFLSKLKDVKKLRLEKQKNDSNFSENITASLNLPPAFKKSVSRAIIQQNPGPKLSISDVELSATGDMKSQIFPPWTTLSSIASNKDLHLLPRPFWRRIQRKNNQLEPSSNIISTGIATPLQKKLERSKTITHE